MTNETQKPDEQPYFTVKVTRCGECPFGRYELCRIEPFEKYARFIENHNGITPSCPMWAKVQTEPPKD